MTKIVQILTIWKHNALDSNAGLQDGKRGRIQWAMAPHKTHPLLLNGVRTNIPITDIFKENVFRKKQGLHSLVNGAVVVVKWPACVPTTPKIQVLIPPMPTVFSVKVVLQNKKINKKVCCNCCSGLQHCINKYEIFYFLQRTAPVAGCSRFNSQLVWAFT